MLDAREKAIIAYRALVYSGFRLSARGCPLVQRGNIVMEKGGWRVHGM